MPGHRPDLGGVYKRMACFLLHPQNTLNGLFSRNRFLCRVPFSCCSFNQVEKFLPDMGCEHPLSVFICTTNASAGTIFADLGGTAVSSFSIFAVSCMSQFMSSGADKLSLPHCGEIPRQNLSSFLCIRYRRQNWDLLSSITFWQSTGSCSRHPIVTNLTSEICL